MTNAETKPRIEIEMTTTEGSTFHTVYEGIYPYYNKSIEWLKQDMNTKMTSVYSWYLEEMNEDRNANLNITLYENIDADGWLVPPSSVLIFVGRGEFDDDGNLIPGTFTITNDENASDYTFLAGGCINFMNAPFPTSTNFCYYYDPENSSAIQVGLAQSGTVEIEKNGDNYTLTYDLTTDKGKKLTGSYTGPIVVQDAPKVIERTNGTSLKTTSCRSMLRISTYRLSAANIRSKTPIPGSSSSSSTMKTGATPPTSWLSRSYAT